MLRLSYTHRVSLCVSAGALRGRDSFGFVAQLITNRCQPGTKVWQVDAARASLTSFCLNTFVVNGLAELRIKVVHGVLLRENPVHSVNYQQYRAPPFQKRSTQRAKRVSFVNFL